jgi:hypothetical protein
MALTQETGDSWRLTFADDQSENKTLTPWFWETTLEEIALYQEGMTPSVGFRQHNEGWWEIRHWEGEPIMGIFVPKSLNITAAQLRIREVYCPNPA